MPRSREPFCPGVLTRVRTWCSSPVGGDEVLEPERTELSAVEFLTGVKS